ncbi:MAG: hypothetical protein ACFB5Z_03160 [Elainellaceae cyanobacterium]
MTRFTRLDYYRLEGFHPQQYPQRSARSKAAAALRGAGAALWNSLFNTLTDCGEPVITARRDRQGRSYYTVYDPFTQSRSTCGSDAEVRQWIEQRYRS